MCYVCKNFILLFVFSPGDFQNLAGCFIPYKQFGCPTLEFFLQNIPNIEIIKNSSGDFMVQARPNEKTAHLLKLVQMQKSSNKTNVSILFYSNTVQVLYYPTSISSITRQNTTTPFLAKQAKAITP
jgi:hypothetical protein